jgi:hypothetical protein
MLLLSLGIPSSFGKWNARWREWLRVQRNRSPGAIRCVRIALASGFPMGASRRPPASMRFCRLLILQVTEHRLVSDSVYQAHRVRWVIGSQIRSHGNY